MPVGYLIWTVILISTEYCKFVMAHESYECFCGGPLISMAVFRSHKHSMQLFILIKYPLSGWLTCLQSVQKGSTF